MSNQEGIIEVLKATEKGSGWGTKASITNTDLTILKSSGSCL